MAKDVPMHNCMRMESGTPRRRNTSYRTGTMTAPPPMPNGPARMPVTTPPAMTLAANQAISVAILALQTADQVLNNSPSSATPIMSRIHANEPCCCMARAALTNVASVRRDSAQPNRSAPASLSCANVMSGFEPTRNHVDRTVHCTHDLTHLLEVAWSRRIEHSGRMPPLSCQDGVEADWRLRMCNAEWLTLTHRRGDPGQDNL